MATTDTTERGLEARITAILTAERPESDQADSLTWLQGNPADYDRSNCVDLAQLSTFLNATQPECKGRRENVPRGRLDRRVWAVEVQGKCPVKCSA